MGKKPSGKLAYASQVALDLLFPPRCAGCSEIGYVWCAKCQRSVTLISIPFCQVCGLPQADPPHCSACAVHPYGFDASRSWGVYSGVLRRAILSLKHRNNPRLGLVLAKQLQKVFSAQTWKVDVVIPIPLGERRFKQRGYNQVEAFARPFSELVGLHYAENILLRQHETLPQFELNAADRWRNLHGSFSADAAPIGSLNVLLVDDIMTTGATLDSAALALRDAGAKSVYGVSVARTL